MYNYIYTLNNLIKNIIEIFIYDSDKLNYGYEITEELEIIGIKRFA